MAGPIPVRTCSRLVALWALTLAAAGALAAAGVVGAEELSPARKIQDQPGLHNIVQVSPRVYSGSEPEGEKAFAALARLGVTTIVSVDGARPNVEAARRHGLKTVHIPIGYDGVDSVSQGMLQRLAQSLSGAAPPTVYVHCHHGQHRGPVAAAVLCLAAGELDTQAALRFLELAGTGKQYAGLWRDVSQFAPLATGTPLPELVEAASVPDFAAAMAELDRHADHLKQMQKAQWRPPADHPDLDPVQEALLLREGLRESLRTLAGDRPEEFRGLLRESQSHAQSLEAALQTHRLEDAQLHFQNVLRSCQTCHERFRNAVATPN